MLFWYGDKGGEDFFHPVPNPNPALPPFPFQGRPKWFYRRLWSFRVAAKKQLQVVIFRGQMHWRANGTINQHSSNQFNISHTEEDRDIINEEPNERGESEQKKKFRWNLHLTIQENKAEQSDIIRTYWPFLWSFVMICFIPPPKSNLGFRKY